jgi:hypothetical protein
VETDFPGKMVLMYLADLLRPTERQVFLTQMLLHGEDNMEWAVSDACLLPLPIRLAFLVSVEPIRALNLNVLVGECMENIPRELGRFLRRYHFCTGSVVTAFAICQASLNITVL